MMKRCLKLVLALALLLPMTGCMSRMAYDDESSRAEAEALVLKFAESMTQGRESALLEIASAPFWVDKWMDLDELRAEIPDDAPTNPPQLSGLRLRIYPLSDLAALRPKVWQQLKDSNPAWIKDVYLGAVALDLRDHAEDKEPGTESGFLLLRRVNGAWKLAGLLEE